MPTIPPRIEVLSGSSFPGDPRAEARIEAAQSNRFRLRLFLIVLAVSLVVSLAFTFLRPAVYRSTATLLIAPPAAFDTETPETKAQYVAVQQQRLTSLELLTQVYQRLPREDFPDDRFPSNPLVLREMLAVKPLPDTYMVELRAEGGDKLLLPIMVNAWVDTYEESHRGGQRLESEATVQALREQSADLEQRVTDKRLSLDEFRRRYDIVSMERDENQVLARLKGLADSLKKANEEVITADSRLESLSQAAAQGKVVVSEQYRVELHRLQDRAAELRGKLNGLARRFTQAYMELDPDIIAMTEDLERTEARIAQVSQLGKREALDTAEQQVVAAQATVGRLEAQLVDYKKTARDFTTRFGEHDALQDELEQLETLYQDVQERLVQEEVSNRYQFPQVTVLDKGYMPDWPIYPHYLRDAGLSLVGSVLMGLLAVALYSVFNRPPRDTGPASMVTAIYPANDRETLVHDDHDTQHLDAPSADPSLTHKPPRELDPAETQALLAIASDAGRRLLLALLGGVWVHEAAALRWRHVDLDKGCLHVPGSEGRVLPLSPQLHKALAAVGPGDPALPLWPDAKGRPLGEDQLRGMIACLAHDTGLEWPEQITPEALMHTYLVYLVRQGLRLGELERVAGPIPPSIQASYGAYSPPGPRLTLEEVEPSYPLADRQERG